LEEFPAGKVPVEMLNVIPIEGMFVYLIKWEPEEGAEEDDICLIKADIFREAYPQIVINFYEKNVAFTTHNVSAPGPSDWEFESSMSSTSSSSAESDGINTDTDSHNIAYVNFLRLALADTTPNPSDDENFRAVNNELGEE